MLRMPSGVHPEYGPFEIDPGLMQVMRTSTGGFEPRHGEHIRSAELVRDLSYAVHAGARCRGRDHRHLTRANALPGMAAQRLSPVSAPASPATCRLSKACADRRGPRAPTAGSRVTNSSPPISSCSACSIAITTTECRRRAAGAGRCGRPHDRLSAIASCARSPIGAADARSGRLTAEVRVENLGGHKLPTAFPSRRAWLHVVVRDATPAVSSSPAH